MARLADINLHDNAGSCQYHCTELQRLTEGMTLQFHYFTITRFNSLCRPMIEYQTGGNNSSV